MKNILILVLVFLSTFNCWSQSTFDKSLNEVSADIAGKLSQKNKKKIVVLYVTDINKAQTVAGKYMADVISVNIVNDQGNFEVFDRENLSGIVEAKKLMAEGYIDANGAKELGKILAVDAIIIGNYTVLTTTLKLTLKALDVNNGFVIAATMKDLPITNDAGALLGINVGSNAGVQNNRGFNTPVQSNENYNNPQTVNKECEQNNTGDFCFMNTTNFQLSVRLSRNSRLVITLDPGQTQCYYSLKQGSYNYEIYEKQYNPDYVWRGKNPPFTMNGQIYIEQCKSKTFTIK